MVRARLALEAGRDWRTRTEKMLLALEGSASLWRSSDEGRVEPRE